MKFEFIFCDFVGVFTWQQQQPPGCCGCYNENVGMQLRVNLRGILFRFTVGLETSPRLGIARIYSALTSK